MAGRASISEWEQEDKIILLSGWARNGLTDEQIAHNMGISRSTLFEWRKKSQHISDALKVNKEIADNMVENALFKAALEGNTTAQIFWLKNRRANEWRDKREESVSAEVEGGGVVLLAPIMEREDG